MIIVKKIEMTMSRTLNSVSVHGDALDVLMAKYINNKHLIKDEIISINIIDTTCAYITHLDKK